MDDIDIYDPVNSIADGQSPAPLGLEPAPLSTSHTAPVSRAPAGYMARCSRGRSSNAPGRPPPSGWRPRAPLRHSPAPPSPPPASPPSQQQQQPSFRPPSHPAPTPQAQQRRLPAAGSALAALRAKRAAGESLFDLTGGRKRTAQTAEISSDTAAPARLQALHKGEQTVGPRPAVDMKRRQGQTELRRPEATEAYYSTNAEKFAGAPDERKRILSYVGRINETDNGVATACERCGKENLACRAYTKAGRAKYHVIGVGYSCAAG
ncbi:hypothetical protein LTR65_010546 [Meristemomyces frigidus]